MTSILDCYKYHFATLSFARSIGASRYAPGVPSLPITD